jgi:ankyrin repeat protein
MKMSKFNTNDKQKQNVTILHLICRYGRLDLLKSIHELQYLTSNILESKDNSNRIPLMTSCLYGHTPLV